MFMPSPAITQTHAATSTVNSPSNFCLCIKLFVQKGPHNDMPKQEQNTTDRWDEDSEKSAVTVITNFVEYDKVL